MYPILFQLGPFTIYSLWLSAAIGFLVAFLVIHRLLQKDRNALNFLSEHSLAIFLGGVIVARIVFLVENFRFYFSQIDISHLLNLFFIWDKGLSFWGGLAGIVITLAFFCKKEKENIWKWLDILIIATMTGLIFGSFGSFLDGSSYGNETDLPWGIILENSRYAVPIHPTQIYAMFYMMGITAMLLNLRNTPFGKKEGNITLIGTTCYAVFRFMEEFIRGDETNTLFGLREAQIFCIIAIAVVGIAYSLEQKKKTTEGKATNHPKEVNNKGIPVTH